MNQRFDPRAGAIIIPTRIQGPTRVAELRLALDTGATRTLVNSDLLLWLGYDPASGSKVPISTASGEEFVTEATVRRIVALGRTRQNFTVLSHSLPRSIRVDGLLGLDFFRGTRLAIDFRKGVLKLSV